MFGQFPDGRTFLCKLNFDITSNGCVLLTIGSIYTKLGDFVKLGLHGLHFMAMWINSCSSHNLNSYLVLHNLKSGSGRAGSHYEYHSSADVQVFSVMSNPHLNKFVCL